MSEALVMGNCSRSEVDGVSIPRLEFIAERVMRHRVKMLEVSKRYFGLVSMSPKQKVTLGA
jgi:hypothetical protein